MKEKYIKANMKAAEIYASLSYAKRRQVGCVIVTIDDLIVVGYNGTPPDWDNNCENDQGLTKPEVIHAEQNALDKIMRNTVSSVGANVFVTTAPCIDCAKRLFGGRVAAVYYRDIYKNTDGIDFLRRAGIPVYKVED